MSVMFKDIIRHAAFPEFRSRFRDLFASGFQYIPFFMALVYGAVRLLPPAHPYLKPVNIGRFGIRHVVAEAANNLVFSMRHIDQILLFVSVLVGIIIIGVQLCFFFMALLVQPVMAAVSLPSSFSGFFITPVATQAQDLCGIMLELVFGIPDIFHSCISDMGVQCTNEKGGGIKSSAGVPWPMEPSAFPMPMHHGLHQVFQMYSLGLMMVGAFITIYFIAMILLETAESGTPFGKRYNRVWAPIRFVVAFGLLVPVGYGMNASQYVVLYAAKFGSGFATNGWNLFNEVLMDSTANAVKSLATTNDTTGQDLVAQPNPPEVAGLLQFLFVAKTCAEMEDISNKDAGNGIGRIKPYVVLDALQLPANNLAVAKGTPYEKMMEVANGKNQIIIRFGREDKEKHGAYMGNVAPICGEMVLRLADPRKPGEAEKGVETMQRYYWYIIKEIWFDTLSSGNFLSSSYDTENYPLNYVHKYSKYDQDENAPMPSNQYKLSLQEFYQKDLRSVMGADPKSTGISGILGTQKGAIQEMSDSGRWKVDETLKEKGWAGAAIWYNRIAELNGNIISAVLNIPMPVRFPAVMEQVYAKKRQYEQNISFSERFNPAMQSQDAPMKEAGDGEKALVYWKAFDFWQQGDSGTTTHSAPTGNAVVDILNALMGTEGLFDMRRNPNVHPLALLAGVGKSLIEGAVRNLTYAAVGGAVGALDNFTKFLGPMASVFSGFLVTFALLGLTAGFVLFYVVPLLPFIYFFFAFGGWVKAIFEAMVGAPLWALAHLRIDGNGLSGQAALSGYLMIFEIFLRPILMVFGLLASISIFSAMVSVLNQVFDLVTANVGGFDVKGELSGEFDGKIASKLSSMRSSVDEFFFTIIYTIIVYMMGMSSFKLIDMIPKQILRWMGANVTTFNDGSEGMEEGLMSMASIGASQATQSLGQGMKGITSLGQPKK